MSLLDDLRGLDISDIVDARGSLTASISAPGIQSTVQAGPASSALGDLGSALDTLREGVPDAAALLRPLAEAFGPLAGRFGADHLPIAELGDAVREGLEFVISLAASVSGEPAEFGRIFGTPLEEAMRVVGDQAGAAASLFGAGADAFASLMDGDAPTDPAAIVALAAELLLPLPHATLSSGRDALARVTASATALHLPRDRIHGLTVAIEAVAVAATPAALDAALRELAQVRVHLLGVLRDDLAFVSSEAARLRPSQLLAPLAAAGGALRLGRESVIDFLDSLRVGIVSLRAAIADLDLDLIRNFLEQLTPQLEAQARVLIEVPVDRAVEAAKDFIRRKLRELPVRALRAEVTRFLHEVAQTIEDAGLDGPAKAAHQLLADVTGKLDPAELTAAVHAALQQVNAALHAALDGVIDALDAIVARVDELAGTARDILGHLADALATFKTAVDGIAAAIAGLGIEEARDQMVEKLRTLRETVSELLSNVPLPEPLRPQIEQLADMVQGIDLDAVFAPVREAAAQLRLPPTLGPTIEGGLAEAARVTENLIPATLAEQLSAEVGGVLDSVRGFNPASLLPDVTGYLEQGAQLIESLDPRPAAEAIRAPFQAVLDAFDKIHPNRLLAPVISAYDRLLGQLPSPDPQTMVTSIKGVFDSAGTVAARAVLEPAARAVGGPGGSASVAEPGAANPAPTAELPPPASEVHAGDAVRLIGVVPARLRTALASLEAGPAGDAMRAVDSLGAGLARDIRALAAALPDVARRLDGDFDAMLSALAPVQLNAQFALQARWGANSGRLRVSLDAVAVVNPGALRAELKTGLDSMRDAARGIAADSAAFHAELERLATALESGPIGRLEGDLDGLLAALDPEPIAVEVDGLVNDMLALAPRLLGELMPDLTAFVDRLQALLNHYHPGAQAQKFLTVIDVLREELEMFDPRRLAAELAEIHAVLRATLTAYDPRVLAEELAGVSRAAAASLRALNPQTLLGDITFFQEAIDRLSAADPGARLATIGTELTEVGERLRAIDVDGLLAAVNELAPRLEDGFEQLIKALRDEIVALLEALRFAGGSASASVSVSAQVS